METFKTVPITLITGYLGSGKTTLINHILKEAKGHKMAVIVNDIGEVNIDAEFIEQNGIVSGKDDNLVALSNGCICCTLKKDLITQLADLVKQEKFDHITSRPVVFVNQSQLRKQSPTWKTSLKNKVYQSSMDSTR